MNREISSSIFHIQNEHSSLEEKLSAIRRIYTYLKETDNLVDYYTKIKLNRLLINGISKLILKDDKLNNEKRQFIRTELFLILLSALNSNSLFGEVNINSSSDDSKKLIYSVDDNVNQESQMNTKTNNLQARPSSHESVQSNNIHKNKLFSNSLTSLSISTKNNSNLGKQSPPLKLLEPIILDKRKKRNSKSNKFLKPRASVFFQGKIESESFVPGVDPYNFIEQDKKLGYQKPRMWFPTAQVATDGHLIPENRTGNKSRSDIIVEEFLKIKALASYLGDLITPSDLNEIKSSNLIDYFNKKNNMSRLIPQVLPSSASAFVSTPNSLNSSSPSFKKAKKMMDIQGIAKATAEIMSIWSPLKGSMIPRINFPSKKVITENAFEFLKPRLDDIDSTEIEFTSFREFDKR